MDLPLITELDRYRRLIRSKDFLNENINVLLVPYTYSGIPNGVDIYYIVFTTQGLRTFTAKGSNIQLGITHSGTCMAGRIQRNQRELCRFL